MITKEDIYRARNVSLPDYFRSKGYKLEPEGNRNYRVCGFQGLIVKECFYNRRSNNSSGTAIDCLVKELNYSFTEAVTELIGCSCMTPSNNSTTKKPDKPKSNIFVMPELNRDQHRAFAYLNKTRKIDASIIEYLLKNKLLLQDKNNNCVFPWYDENRNIVGASLQGTLSSKRFKGIVSGSAEGYGFNISFGHKYLYFFEDAIDALSFLCLFKKEIDINNSSFISMNGIKDIVVNTFAYLYPRSILTLCVDNDTYDEIDKTEFERRKGIDFHISISKQQHSIRAWYPYQKDWNEELILLKCLN